MNIHPDIEGSDFHSAIGKDRYCLTLRVFSQCFYMFVVHVNEHNTSTQQGDHLLRHNTLTSLIKGDAALACWLAHHIVDTYHSFSKLQPLIFSRGALIKPQLSHLVISGLCIFGWKCRTFHLLNFYNCAFGSITHTHSHSLIHCVQDPVWVPVRKVDEHAFYIVFLILDENVEQDEAEHKVDMTHL